MRQLIKASLQVSICLLLWSCNSGKQESFRFDSEEIIWLDAETLAEGGVKEAYDKLVPRLRTYGAKLDKVEESLDVESSRYVVKHRGERYVVYAPEVPSGEGRSWARASFALFSVVNRQLEDSELRFYAIDGGNDLRGIFLKSAELETAKKALPYKADWPYSMTLEHPWYGQLHD